MGFKKIPLGVRTNTKTTFNLRIPENTPDTKTNIFMLGKQGIGKCQRGDTKVLLNDGSLIEIKDLDNFLSKKVLSLNENNLKFEWKNFKLLSQPVQELYGLKLSSGKEIFLTAEHPLFKFEGWTKLKDLKAGDLIATPREYNLNLKKQIPPEQVILLAYFLAEGNVIKCAKFTNIDKDINKEFEESIFSFDSNLKITSYIGKNSKAKHLNVNGGKRNYKKSSITNFLIFHEMYGCNSGTKQIPKTIFLLQNKQVALFLNRYFSCDGCAEKTKVSVISKSKKIIEGIVHLLLRFGVHSRMRVVKKCATNTKKKIKRNYFELNITGFENILKFKKHVDFFHEEKKEKLEKLVLKLSGKKVNSNVDVIPKEVFNSWRPDNWVTLGKELNYSTPKASRGFLRVVSRNALKKIRRVYKAKELGKFCDSEIFWDKVISVKYVGKEKTFDLEVVDNHNFVANDIVVHNSNLISLFIYYMHRMYLETGGTHGCIPVIFSPLFEYVKLKEKSIIKKGRYPPRTNPQGIDAIHYSFRMASIPDYLTKEIVVVRLKFSDLTTEDIGTFANILGKEGALGLIDKTLEELRRMNDGDYTVAQFLEFVREQSGDVFNALYYVFKRLNKNGLFDEELVEFSWLKALKQRKPICFHFGEIDDESIMQALTGILLRHLYQLSTKYINAVYKTVNLQKLGQDPEKFLNEEENWFLKNFVIGLFFEEAHQFFPPTTTKVLRSFPASRYFKLISMAMGRKRNFKFNFLVSQRLELLYKEFRTEFDALFTGSKVDANDKAALGVMFQQIFPNSRDVRILVGLVCGNQKFEFTMVELNVLNVIVSKLDRKEKLGPEDTALTQFKAFVAPCGQY